MLPGLYPQRKTNVPTLLSKDYISRCFKRACKRAKLYIPYYTVFHALRHSYATVKLHEGMHLMELKNYMGHNTTKTIEKYAKTEVGVTLFYYSKNKRS